MNLKSFVKWITDVIIKWFIVWSLILWLLTFFKPELIKHFLGWIEGIVGQLWYLNYLIVFISSTIEWIPLLWVVVPGQNIMLIVGGFFAKLGMVNLVLMIIIASIWGVCSNYIGYLLWVYYGEEFFNKYGLWIGIGQTELKIARDGIKKWGALWIIFWKFHNVTRAFIPFIAGTMKMNKKRFFIYNIIGSVLWAVVIIILWVLFAQYYKIVVDYFKYIFLAILIIFALYIYIYKKDAFKKYMDDKTKELENLPSNNKSNEK